MLLMKSQKNYLQDTKLKTIYAYDRLLHILKQLEAYPELDYYTSQYFRNLIGFFSYQISSNEENVAQLALSCMSFLIQNKGYLSSISYEMAVGTFLSLVELIKSTKSKEMCKIGVECILAQKFEPHILSSKLSHLLEGILQAVNNGSLCISDAFEVLYHCATQMEHRMRELAHIWAALIYEKLLSFEAAERELADNYLKKMKAIVLPPTPLLAKVVAESVQNKLLANMQRMLESQSYKVPVITAWGWFIWLLGGRVLHNRSLVNSMLKILEQTFLDRDIDVRISSQVAWKSMVDILLPPSSENGMEKDLPGGSEEPVVQLTSKRMKLLITPLVGTMTVEKSVKARNSCWRICVYILQKLSCSVNKTSVMQFILVPIFESIFKSGRNNWNVWVWDSCVSLFEEFLLLKVAEKLQRTDLPIDGPPIKWSPWMFCHLQYLLKIFRSLWKSYAEDVKGNENRKVCFKFVLRIWQLMLEGLHIDGSSTTNPSTEHRASVHHFLHFVSSTSDEVALLFMSTHDRDLVFSLWCLVECMVLKLGPSVLTSSFYKLPLDLRIVNGALVSTGVGKTASRLVGNNQSCANAVQFEEMGTPIIYASMVWLKFVASLGFEDRNNLEDLCLKMDNYWLLCLWRAFSEHRIVVQEQSACDINSESREFVLCSLLFPCLISSASNAKEIRDNTEDSILSNIIPSSGDMWFLTEDFNKICNPTMWRLLVMISGDSQQTVMTGIGEKCPVHFTNLDVSQCSLLMNIRCIFSTIYGRFVACLVKETESCFNGNATLHHFGPACTEEAGRMDKTSILTGTLSLAARFLMLINEARKSNTKSSDAINSVCEALVSLSNCLQTSDDILQFVQTLSEPLAKWLCACLNREDHPRRHSVAHELEEISSLKQVRSNDRECEIGTRRLGIDRSSNFNGPNSYDNGTILALVSRFFIITWEAQNDNREIDMDSVSRVGEGLICFSNYLKTQHDTLQFMQALSEPLVKWFSGSAHLTTVDDTGQHMLLLEKIWIQLLTSLQNCYPPISFDSDFLNLQAPLLASAFQCPLKQITDQTLLFWKGTYGIKTCRLAYPPCLVPVLRDLQRKVKIALPGFLHTYVSRRGLKHQTKLQVQKCCATGNATFFSDAPDGHNGKGHDDMAIIGGNAALCAGRRKADVAIGYKTPVSIEEVVEVKSKVGRPRKHKNGATETSVLNHASRNSIGGHQISDLAENVSIKHNGDNKHGNEGNVDLNMKSSIPDGKLEVNRKRGRRPRKHKLQKYNQIVIGKKPVRKQENGRSLLGSLQSQSGPYNKQAECIREHNAGVYSKRAFSKECLELTKGNHQQLGRRRNSEKPQIKLLTSDLKTLGIRHLRSLRNVGGLRGGKDWRVTHETGKQLPKMSRRQTQKFSAVERNDVDRATITDRKTWLSGTNSSNMRIVDHAMQTDRQVVEPCSIKKLSSWTCSKVDPSQKVCQTSELSASESPFKVRALGRGLSLEDSGHVVPLSCNMHSVSSSEKNSDCGSRKNRRKSGTPKRIPSNLLQEDNVNFCYGDGILSQFQITTDDERISTKKRLKDAGHQIFTSNKWNNAEAGTPYKKLKTEDGKCSVKKPNAKFELDNNVDDFHMVHLCRDDMTQSTGICLQVSKLTHYGNSGRKTNLASRQWQQEGLILDANMIRTNNNAVELEAKNEVSSEAQSEAVNESKRTEETHTTDDQPQKQSNRVPKHDPTKEKKQYQRKNQLPQLHGSSGTSHECCVEPSITSSRQHACTNNGDNHHFSKKGIASLEGKEWDICDILSEICSSSRLEGLDLQDSLNAEMLLRVLSKRIAKRKKLLLETR